MNFDELWEELRAENPELIDKVDQRVAEIRSLEKPRGCPPDYNPGFCDDPDEEICDRCWASWEKRKPKHTNADRLRAMSDEELADWFVSLGGEVCPFVGDCQHSCRQCWLDWLRQEVPDEP